MPHLRLSLSTNTILDRNTSPGIVLGSQIKWSFGAFSPGAPKNGLSQERAYAVMSLVLSGAKHYLGHAETKMASGSNWNPDDLVFRSRAGNRLSLSNLRNRAFRRIKQRGRVSEA